MVDVSVIIVSYNEKEYLSQAIESCIKQKFEGTFEIIIGDDGSTDGSIALIEEYESKYPESISHFVMDRSDIKDVKDIIPSVRVSNVLKKAFSLANGEYIICLSGDDYFTLDNVFQYHISVLKNGKYVASCSNFKLVWNNGEEKNNEMPKIKGEKLFWSMYYIHLSCFMFKRDVFEKDNLLERFCDDTGMIYSILLTGKCFYNDIITMAYRQRDFSIMHEADKLELFILELLLFQDILNKKRMILCSKARFFGHLRYVYKNRDDLSNNKYKKYFFDAKKYKNNYIGIISQWSDNTLFNKMKVYYLMATCFVSYVFHRVVNKIIL